MIKTFQSSKPQVTKNITRDYINSARTIIYAYDIDVTINSDFEVIDSVVNSIECYNFIHTDKITCPEYAKDFCLLDAHQRALECTESCDFDLDGEEI